MITKRFYYVHFPPLRICEGRKEGKAEIQIRRVSLGTCSSEIPECFRTVGEALFFFSPGVLSNIAVTCSVISS